MSTTEAAPDVSSLDDAVRAEALARLWELIYGLRAELLAVSRLERWPAGDDAGDELRAARSAALWQMARLLLQVRRCADTQLGELAGGGAGAEADVRAAALIRLAGWPTELPVDFVRDLRTVAATAQTREAFDDAVARAGIRLGSSAA